MRAIAAGSLRADLDRDGFACFPELLDVEECEYLLRCLEPFVGKAGTRNLLSVRPLRALADRLAGERRLSEAFADDAIAVQCTLFAKTAEANWGVAPHQDLSIPVAERRVATGWSGWSTKEGMCFVQPPVSVLESMVAVRVQLDAAGAGSGALKVYAGSHRNGRLSSAQIAALACSNESTECLVPKGGAVILKPLAVHASSKATVFGMRRVLHFLFGPRRLPDGMRWASAR